MKKKMGRKYYTDLWDSGPLHCPLVLLVPSSLNCFVFGAERKENSSKLACPRRILHEAPAPTPAPCKMLPLVSVDFIVPWELIAQQGLFS